MNKYHRNGWAGQALAEYWVLYGWLMVFLFAWLVLFSPKVADSYRGVNECFEDATQGIACEETGGETSNPPPSGDNNNSPDNSNNNSNGDNSSDDNSNDGNNNSGDNTSNDSSNNNSNNDSGDDSSNDDSSNNDGGMDEESGGESPPGMEDDNPTGDSNNPSGNGQCPADVDFNSLAAGTILTDQFPGMVISTMDDENHPAMIFDSSNPSGGDYDLGTPSTLHGGPGYDNGHGSPEAAESNDTALGNLIIISEDGDTSDPDDNATGGTLYFDFENATNVSYMYFVDADNPTGAALVTLRDQAGNMLAQRQVQPPAEGGGNGVFRLDFDQTGVYQIEVFFNGVSGAIASVFFCEPPVTEDNTVSSTTPPYNLQCNDVMPVIIEPREDDAQHVMVQYPVECDANGNYIPVQAGVSNMEMSNSSSTYFRATLSGHLTGTFEAWCVDYDNPIAFGADYTGDNYGTPDVSVDRPENLPLVAWLINANLQGQGYTVEDIQGAIWLLVDSTPIARADLGSASEELVQLAEQNAGDSSTNPSTNIDENANSNAGNSATLQTITVDTSETGNISTGSNNRVLYALTLTDGELVDIDLENVSGIDPYLRVYNSDGTVLLAQNDDISWPDNANSRISDFTVSGGGTVIIQVGTYNDASSGTYRLTVAGQTDAGNNGGNSSNAEPVITGTAITDLSLIDTSTNSSVGSVSNFSVIDLSEGYAIRADTSGNIGSVHFFMNDERIQPENAAPYAIAGDSNGDFRDWNYESGTHTLRVVAYSGRNGNGNEIGTYTLEITIEN